MAVGTSRLVRGAAAVALMVVSADLVVSLCAIWDSLVVCVVGEPPVPTAGRDRGRVVCIRRVMERRHEN